MFASNFEKTADWHNREASKEAREVNSKKYKKDLNRSMKITAGVAGVGALGMLYFGLKKKASDMSMKVPKKETPEQKKIREQAEITSLGA